MKINVKIKKLKDSVKLPEYATPGSAALDLRSAEDADVVIKARGRALIHTGLAVAVEDSSVVSVICARSGLATKHGIALANGIGVVDSDYRGEIMVSLVNNSDTDYTIAPDERIAQLMFMPVYAASIIEAETLDETSRGAGGFGSTGNK